MIIRRTSRVASATVNGPVSSERLHTFECASISALAVSDQALSGTVIDAAVAGEARKLIFVELGAIGHHESLFANVGFIDRNDFRDGAA